MPDAVEWERLKALILEGKRLVVFLHNHPDPDALAAGWLLQRIALGLGVQSRIVYGGQISRAENQTMVKLLRIPARPLRDGMRLHRTDRFALVDTQPGSGNNSFPNHKRRCHLVIDHHPKRAGLEADFADVREDQGCCTTMLLQYFRQSGFELDPALATAAAYAISSETQDLEREATADDRHALQDVLPLADLRALGRIRHPVRDRDYYRAIARAMASVQIARNTCVCHIGEVYQPGVPAEVADFLIQMERVTWCLVTGLHQGAMVLSIRASQEKARADRVMRSILRGLGRGGGHQMMAGGSAPCPNLDDYREKTALLSERFLKRLSRRQPEHLRPLVE